MKVIRKLGESLLPFAILLNVGCGGGQDAGTGESFSTSAIVAGIIGGAVNGSSPTGTQSQGEKTLPRPTIYASGLQFLNLLPRAIASESCPSVVSGSVNCSGAGSTETLTYSSCQFTSGGSTWNGSQIITIIPGTLTCGVFPGANYYTGNYQRTFGSVTTRGAGSGTVAIVDTSGGVTAFNGVTYSGGTTVNFNAGLRTSISIQGTNVVAAEKFNCSVTTIGTFAALTFNENTLSVTGSVIVYDNLAQVKGISTVAIAFSPGCCLPTSGTIKTTFSAVNGFSPIQGNYSGRTETLTLKGCGVGTLVAIDGTTSTVLLTQCF